MEIALQLLINGLLVGGIYALISTGLTLVFGVMRIINFAHGEFLMISMYMVYWLNVKLGMDPYLAMIVIIPVMFLIGILIYQTTLNPIVGKQDLLTILMTVGVMIFLQNIALMLWNADVRSISIPYGTKTLGTNMIRVGVTRLASFAVAIGTAIGLLALLDKTWIGKSIKATSQNRDAAKLMGVDTKKTFMIAFGIGTATVGVAGAALAPIFSIFPTIGQQFGTISFVVVVLGGLGSVPGAVFGGLIIGMVSTFSSFLLPTGYTEAVYLAIFLLVLLLRPNGLLGKAKAGGGR
jgi:Branched-chain amino acid ABC-type transport system, permease components